jgi:glutathione gamma-glutamylcysteinyltransferase
MSAPDGATFYRRPLPDFLTSFETTLGRKYFTEALLKNHMETYFPIASQFHTQSEPSFCGLGTLVTVLNSLTIDPGRSWKGVWRWFSEEMLDCCKPIEEIIKEGLTLSQVACLARCNNANVTTYYAENSNVDQFRELVKMVSSEGGYRMAISYDRKGLGQTGAGHFSPIGGYHEDDDMVLIMDVARFKYPPHWAPIKMVFDAMNTIDDASGRSRGFIIFQNKTVEQCVLCQVTACKYQDISERGISIMEMVEDAVIKSETIPELLVTLHNIFTNYEIFEFYNTNLSPEHLHKIESIILELRNTNLYKAIKDIVETPEHDLDHTVILILSILDCSSNLVKNLLRERIEALLDIPTNGSLFSEIQKMKSIFINLGITTNNNRCC